MSFLRLAVLGSFALWMLALSAHAQSAPTTPPVGYQSLFNGKDLSGWEGNREIWRVEGGTIIGEAAKGLDKNQFLATTRRYQDFSLVLQFRLVGGRGNSGVQFRSERIPNHHEMIGYQADVGEKYWGCLYDESRRKKVLVQAPPELEKASARTAGTTTRSGAWETASICCSTACRWSNTPNTRPISRKSA